jgi:hypothetical protein
MGLVEETLSDDMVVELIFRVISGPREEVSICYLTSVSRIIENKLRIHTIR